MVPLIAMVGFAFAAEVSHLPAGPGVGAGLTYVGTATSGGLVEAGERVSERRIQRHDLSLSAELAPISGLALTLEGVVTPALVYRYPDARTMTLEPTDGSGSYLSGEISAEEALVKGAGFTGVWIGAAAAPFSEAYRSSDSSWRVDFGVRPPSASSNIWTASGGNRGTAPGGLGLRVIGAFSSERGVTQPFLVAKLQREMATTIEIVDEQGNEFGALDLRPASTIDMLGGVEVLAYEDDTGAELSAEFSFGAGYRSWEDIASGVYLPNVLDGAKRIPVTAGDAIRAQAGLGMHWKANEAIGGHLRTHFAYTTPRRLEHVYDVRTSADTWTIGWELGVGGETLFVPEE